MSKGLEGFRWHLLTVAVFVAVSLAWVIFILSESGTLPSTGKEYEVKAVVPTASLLTPGARVTAAGVEVGSLKSVERADDVGPRALLTLELTDEDVFPIPRDTTVAVRTRSQVGENYVSLQIGDDPTDLENGGTLAVDQAEPVVNVDEILSVLRGKTRERTRVLFHEFGDALTGRGDDLNRTIRGVNDFTVQAADFVDVLHSDREDVAQLVDQLGRVMSAVGDRGEAIDTIASQGLVALRAIGDRDAALAETFRELPETLEIIERSATTVGTVSDESTPVVENLATATRDLLPAIRDLPPTASAGRNLVAALDYALPGLENLVIAGAQLPETVEPALPEIRTTFCQLNPALRYILPYRNDILQIVYHLGSGANSYDATGHMVRLTPVLNENSISGAPPEVTAAANTLLQSGLFLPQKVINYDPYMKPGVIGNTTATSGSPANPEDLKESGYVYPRVKADCH